MMSLCSLASACLPSVRWSGVSSRSSAIHEGAKCSGESNTKTSPTRRRDTSYQPMRVARTFTRPPWRSAAATTSVGMPCVFHRCAASAATFFLVIRSCLRRRDRRAGFDVIELCVAGNRRRWLEPRRPFPRHWHAEPTRIGEPVQVTQMREDEIQAIGLPDAVENDRGRQMQQCKRDHHPGLIGKPAIGFPIERKAVLNEAHREPRRAGDFLETLARLLAPFWMILRRHEINRTRPILGTHPLPFLRKPLGNARPIAYRDERMHVEVRGPIE